MKSHWHSFIRPFPNAALQERMPGRGQRTGNDQPCTNYHHHLWGQFNATLNTLIPEQKLQPKTLKASQVVPKTSGSVWCKYACMHACRQAYKYIITTPGNHLTQHGQHTSCWQIASSHHWQHREDQDSWCASSTTGWWYDEIRRGQSMDLQAPGK